MSLNKTKRNDVLLVNPFETTEKEFLVSDFYNGVTGVNPCISTVRKCLKCENQKS
jgi:hypothetical protein